MLIENYEFEEITIDNLHELIEREEDNNEYDAAGSFTTQCVII